MIETWTKIVNAHPPRHQMFLVRRNGMIFTATPCYGLHSPWWVVRTMADNWPNEADPVAMRDDDEWQSLSEVKKEA